MIQKKHQIHNCTSYSASGVSRSAFTRRDLVLVLVVCAIAFSITPFLLLHAREQARRQQCTHNLNRFGTALLNYHTSYQCLPPAAFWKCRKFDDINRLHQTRQFEAITYANWLQTLLPFLNKEQLLENANPDLPVGAPENQALRTTQLNLATCPSDEYQRSENNFTWPSKKYGSIHFARGNYAINGGTHRFAKIPGTTADPVPNGYHYEVNHDTREMAYWGNGIAGFNRSFSFSDMTNGLSSLVAIDEIRAGIHPYDSRGVWALGQIGGSVTWSHGMNGDAGYPNDSWQRADDIIGCYELHETLGEQALIESGMPCCSYCMYNDQATARSRHKQGVHALMLDGSTRFISNSIEPGIWHVMHSRDTPPGLLLNDISRELESGNTVKKHGHSGSSPENKLPVHIENSLGMSFSQIKPGRFIMGLPDEEINAVFDQTGFPRAHWVKFQTPYFLGHCEVTQAQFHEVMGFNPSSNQLEKENSNDKRDRYPVENVTFNEAQLFCERLGKLHEELSAGRTYRLPTEAEWEYACRSGNINPYIYIPDRQPGDQSGENAMKSPPLGLSPVGHYPANQFGLFDMRGNVWEWCNDWFSHDYYNRSPELNPQGPSSGYLKVVRGCDWIFVGQRCSLGFRAVEPWKRNPYIGFRVVCEVSNSKQ